MAITERVEKIRQNYVNTKPHISYERAWSWTKSFQRTEGQAHIIRTAQAFKDTCMETCGYFDFESVRESLERMDLIFMDLKLMDDARHRQYTGISNEKTLTNIARLNEVPASVVIRIPTIGGVNADEDNIRRSAAFVHETLPKARMELLPYHKFGTIKYEALGMPYHHPDFYRPSAEEMEHLCEIVRREGVEIMDFR